MAASREGPLRINLVHGAKSHSVTLTPEEGSDVLTINDLMIAAHGLTSVPPHRQKLLFKGKSLTQLGDLNLSLRSVGARQGSKIMLLGSKPDKSGTGSRTKSPDQQGQGHTDAAQTGEDMDMDKLSHVEQSVNREETSLKTLLQHGHSLHCSGERKQLEELKKGLLQSTESLMRLLESLDALRVQTSDTAARAKRKALVDQIQKLMDQCEEMLTSTKQTLAGTK